MIELPTEAVGFHGTHRGAVPHLLAREIEQSDQHFEWLGTGFYVWQDSPWRAQAWAVDRHGEDAAVVVARVSVDGCLEWSLVYGIQSRPVGMDVDRYASCLT